MTKMEFSESIAWIATAIERPICEGSAQEQLARTQVYFEMLGDLPTSAFRAAAKQATLQNLYGKFPSIELLRRLAMNVMAKNESPTAGEAWELAWQAACKIDPEVEGSAARHTAKLPAEVRDAIQAFGVVALCSARPNFARKEFCDIYERIVSKRQRHAMLPESLRKQIESIGAEQIADKTPQVKAIAGAIGLAS